MNLTELLLNTAPEIYQLCDVCSGYGELQRMYMNPSTGEPDETSDPCENCNQVGIIKEEI